MILAPDLLYIDQYTLKETKTKWKNLAMACIYYKRVYDVSRKHG